jgi:hypothetical protein
MVQTRRIKAAEAAEQQTVSIAPKTDAFPLELYYMIMEELRDDMNLRTLLELSLANNTLLDFGLPLVKSVPRRDVWIALHEIRGRPDPSLQIVETYGNRLHAQSVLEDLCEGLENDWVREEGVEDRDWCRLRQTTLNDGGGSDRFSIERHFVVGKLDNLHVWLRVRRSENACGCVKQGTLEGAFQNEANTKETLENDATELPDVFNPSEACDTFRIYRTSEKIKLRRFCCWSCGRRGNSNELKMCGTCKEAVYCGIPRATCQRRDWRERHKLQCFVAK